MLDSTILGGLYPQKSLATNSFGLTFTRNVKGGKKHYYQTRCKTLYESDCSSLPPHWVQVLTSSCSHCLISPPTTSCQKHFSIHSRDWGFWSGVNSDHFIGSQLSFLVPHLHPHPKCPTPIPTHAPHSLTLCLSHSDPLVGSLSNLPA